MSDQRKEEVLTQRPHGIVFSYERLSEDGDVLTTGFCSIDVDSDQEAEYVENQWAAFCLNTNAQLGDLRAMKEEFFQRTKSSDDLPKS